MDVISHAALLAWEPVEDMPDYRARARADYAAVGPTAGPVDDVLRALVTCGTIFEPTLFIYFANERTATVADWAARVTSLRTSSACTSPLAPTE